MLKNKIKKKKRKKKEKKKRKGERVCTVLDGRKKKMGVCPDGRRRVLYIYIMSHYYDDDNEKKNLALFYWFGVPRQVGNSLGVF